MGSSCSCVGPAIGRLMLANWPPLGCSHFQTFGGTYSVIAVPSLAQPERELGSGGDAFQCQRCNQPALLERNEGRGPFQSLLISSTTGRRSPFESGTGSCLGCCGRSRLASSA